MCSQAGEPVAAKWRDCRPVSFIAERQINLLSSPKAQPGVSSMKAFVLIVTFAAAGGAGDEHTERIANFDDYQACASAGRSLYPREHWECVPANQPPQAGTNR